MNPTPDWVVVSLHKTRRAKDRKPELRGEAWLLHVPTHTKLVVMGPGAVDAVTRAKEWFELIDHKPAFATHCAADHLSRASRARFHKQHIHTV